ncbi:MAG: DUF4118 domain-containing protein, partial [Gemmatimonadaceae bacterium]
MTPPFPSGLAPPRRSSGGALHPPRARWLRYLAPAAVWAVALILTLVLAPWIQRELFTFFWVAVLFAAWYGGLGPALLAALAAVLVVDYYLVRPVGTLSTLGTDELRTFAIFVGVSLSVSFLAAGRARAQRRATERARAFEALAQRLQEQAAAVAPQMAEMRSLARELAKSNDELGDTAAQAD